MYSGTSRYVVVHVQSFKKKKVKSEQARTCSQEVDGVGQRKSMSSSDHLNVSLINDFLIVPLKLIHYGTHCLLFLFLRSI